MSEKKGVVYIDCELLILLGIDPEEAVKYLESKDGVDISPVHVNAHRILKRNVVPSS
jgi:hypothetical protein